ncbi:MAG: AAA family ATPase [Chitinophagaceae bacterium]|nr:AAA family ATPase [Chitinophagaceae bacterium]
METLVGRHEEKKILAAALASGVPELVAIYGRRRIGKTFLVRSFYKERLLFDFTGIHNADLSTQLENFSIALQKAMSSAVPAAVPQNWIQAFFFLEQYLTPKIKKQKAVIFFDEFPWIHTPRSGFLQAFGHFWNTWASMQPNIVVVICGSAASWMIQNIVNNKGGLHNRITRTIRLLPFDLGETDEYLKSRAVKLNHYQVLQIYMAMGGVPQYLSGIVPGESAAQNIDRLYFSKTAPLRREFNNLYESLFTNARHHIAVIKALSKKGKGLTRNEVIKACGLSSGGTTTRLLEELEESGFIARYIPFERDMKDSIYKLFDEYSLFYLKYIEGSRASGKGTWLRLANSPSFTSWAGFSFETICQKHLVQIKKRLGIEAVYTEASAWRQTAQKGKQGAQIDLLIDRQDACINVCEIKFSVTEFTIDKQYAAALENKMRVFKSAVKTKKTLFLTMITTYGIQRNMYATGLVQSEIKMDALFRQ